MVCELDLSNTVKNKIKLALLPRPLISPCSQPANLETSPTNPPSSPSNFSQCKSSITHYFTHLIHFNGCILFHSVLTYPEILKNYLPPCTLLGQYLVVFLS